LGDASPGDEPVRGENFFWRELVWGIPIGNDLVFADAVDPSETRQPTAVAFGL
jgi:hypothetical protein